MSQTATSTEAVSQEDVRRVAELANLELTQEECEHMQQDLNAILVHVQKLSELDTENVEPLAQISELVADVPTELLRADAIKPSVDRSEVMAAAPETDQAFFKVPKVIER